MARERGSVPYGAEKRSSPLNSALAARARGVWAGYRLKVATAARGWQGSNSKGRPFFFNSRISTRTPSDGPGLAPNRPSQKFCSAGIVLKYEFFNRSEEHTSELQSHSFISYAVFCLKKTT